MPDQEHKRIADFIDALVADEKLEGRFLDHPRQVMKDFGLDPDQITKVMDSKLGDLKNMIESEVGGKVLAFRVKRG